MENEGGSESVLDSLGVDSPIPDQKTESNKADTPAPTPMETNEAEPEPDKKSDKMEPDEEPNNKSEDTKDEGEQKSEKQSDERTAEPDANGTVGEEEKESSQKAKGKRSTLKKNETAAPETPPPSKRPRRSVTQQKKTETPKKEEPKSKKSKPSSPAKKETEKNPKTPKRTSDKPQKPKESSQKKTPSNTASEDEDDEPLKKKKISSDSDVVEEFIDCEYLKGEIIAVRTEGLDFYLAECQQNITEADLDKSDEFKVQWFDVSEEENVYVRSYHDKVDHRSVVCTEVKLKKESGGRWRLKPPMLKKIKNRLQRALDGAPMTSSDDDDDGMKDESSPLKLPGGKKEGSSQRSFGGTKKKKDKKDKKKNFARTPVGKITDSPKPYLAPLGTPTANRLKMVVEKPKSSKSRNSSGKSEVVNQKSKYEASPFRRGRPPIHDTAYIPNTESPEKMSVDDKQNLVEVENDPAEAEQPQVDADANLKPNEQIQAIEQDPAFNASGNPFNLPREVMAIKCVLQRDFDSLQKLTTTIDTSSQNRLPYTIQGFRSPDDKKTVLHFALQTNDEEFVKALLQEISAKSDPDQVHESDTTLLSHFIAKDATDSEAGNKALIRQTVWNIDWRDPDVAREVATFSCHEGCLPSILDLLMENYPKLHGGVTMRELLIERVYQSLENGHIKSAHHLVELSNTSKSSPCAFSELQLQTLCSTMDRDHPYQISVKHNEIRKKENINMRITAMHTAAANPNGQFLKRLLEMNPDARNNSDERGRRPIHYAAASYSSEPLQILFKPKNFGTKQLNDKELNIDEVDKTGTTPLMICSQLGRENNCQVILECAKKTKMINPKALVNRVDTRNYTALHYAAEAGHENIISLLHKWQADLDKPLGIKARRITPLMLACRNGHFKTAKTLINLGCKIEVKDKLGRTALMHAALNGHYPLVALLLNKGANPNSTDKTDNTSLHFAAAYGWYHVVQLLLQGGASPDVVNQERISPLAVSVFKYHDDVAQLLFNHGADPNLSDNQKRTLLMLLASEKPSAKVNERISYLLDHFSPSPNVQDIHGLTVIHHLASSKLSDTEQADLVQTAKLLLNGGADLNMKDYASRTALFHAAKSGNLPLMTFFMDKGANCPESRANDQNGENMLHLIVRLWRKGEMSKMVKELHRQSSTQLQDLATSRSKGGFTPLLLASKLMAECTDDFKGNLATWGSELLDSLITVAKSDPSAAVAKGKYSKSNRDNKDEGKTAAHYLSTSSNNQLLSTLLKNSPRLDCLDSSGLTPLTSALLTNQNAAANMLLENGALVDFCSNSPSKHEYNMAPLVFACAKHSSKSDCNLIPAIKNILEKIEDINEVKSCPVTNYTALMFACREGQDPALVKLLLRKGAKVQVQDTNGQTALHHGVLSTKSNCHVSQIIELLLDAGADPFASDKKGLNSVHLAFQEPNQDPMEMLALLTQRANSALIDSTDNEGNTALHKAASIGSMTSILHLTSIGASINIKNKEGNTPIGLAIKNSHQSSTVLLAQLGAELNTKIVYSPESTIEGPAGSEYWTSSKQQACINRIVEKDAVEVVIKHKWRNVMTLMLSRLLKSDEGMDTDYDLDRPSGFTFARCVEAACTVPDFETALVLVRRQKDEKELKVVNQDDQTLLHILAINSRGNQPELKEIADMLIKANVSIDAADRLGMTALHYAVWNKCDVLVQCIIRAAGSKAESLVNSYDNTGRTPITALFWNTDLNDTQSVRILTDLSSALGDMAAITLSSGMIPMPHKDALEALHEENRLDYFQNPSSTMHITPLMRAIYVNGARVIDKLLELGVDTNAQVEDNGNLTALMLAVECNNLAVVRRLLESENSQPIILSTQDSNLRNVLHHVTRPSKWGYWENAEIMKLLIEKGTPLAEEDVHGKSALDYALDGGNGKLSNFLQDIMSVPLKERQKPKGMTSKITDNADFSDNPEHDYVNDAKAILEKIHEDEETSKKPPGPEVDALSGMADWGQIIEDLTTGLHGDVLLSEVEVKGNGDFSQNFTRMQIIGHKLKKQFVLFKRQGQVGQDGEWKIQPFSIPENAIREFMKLYKAKTGNEWTALPEFRRCTKKSALVPFDLMNRIQAADLEFDLETDAPSKLSPELQTIFLEFTNVNHLKEIVKKSILDHTIMPFGRLIKESLETGLNTLFDIKDLVLALYEAKQALTNVLDTNRMQWFLEQTMSLTFEFNKSVPNQGKRIERIKLLSDLAEIENKIKQTRDLIKLEFANNLLLAAQYRINDANPIDYIYKSLNCQMVALKRDCEESSAIVKFVENSGCESTVMQMFKVYREADVESLVSSDIENHKLLWMPTSLTNVLYTLAKGTAVPCPQSERKDNPSRYRKGLDKHDDDSFSIFYEMFEDVKSECQTFSTEKKYAFLCQVAVGKSKDVQEIPKQRPEGVFDSIKIAGKDSFSNDDHVIISPEGASIPLGKRNTTNPTASFPSNRYLIYNDTNQMAIRYLVRFN